MITVTRADLGPNHHRYDCRRDGVLLATRHSSHRFENALVNDRGQFVLTNRRSGTDPARTLVKITGEK